ncbi:Lipid phosphate phosphatase 1 [Bienertia sinuspersici]
MTLAEVRAYTIKFHGTKVAKTHLHDWAILLLLVLIEIVLNIISPFYRYVGKDMMTDLKYPLQPNTVPVWAVPIYAVLLPIIVFVIRYFKRRDVHDLHHGILGKFRNFPAKGLFFNLFLLNFTI